MSCQPILSVAKLGLQSNEVSSELIKPKSSRSHLE